MLSVLYENEKNTKKKEKYYSVIKSSIDEAIKYDPANKLARNLYDRFIKR